MPAGWCLRLSSRGSGADYRVAPGRVLVDPVRAERMLGLATGPQFSSNDQQPGVTHTLLDPLAAGELIVNVRAGAAPDLRAQILRAVAGGWRGPQLAGAQLESYRHG